MSELQKVDTGAGVWQLLKVWVNDAWQLAKECCCGGDPCDHDTILATLTGLEVCSCDEVLGDCSANQCYVLQNLSLSTMPVTLTRPSPDCCFEATIGTVDLYSFDPFEAIPCTTLTYEATVDVILFAYCYFGNSVNVVAAPDLSGYGLDPVMWSDGGVNGWTDWPNPNFGTFTRYIPDCSSGYITKGGTLTLEAP